MSDDNETRDRQPEGRRPAWQSGTPRGQERVVSYESDERYWTDYLRVALPVVGLLLMLGLLFWWTNSIIGDDQGTQPTNTVVADASNVATVPVSTAENTVEPNLTPATVENNPTTPDDAAGTETVAGDATEEPVACDSDFKNGDLVQVTESGDGVRLRDEATLDEGDFPELPAGTQLDVSSDCFVVFTAGNGEETIFRRVTTTDAGEGFTANARGFVAEEFLELVEE